MNLKGARFLASLRPLSALILSLAFSASSMTWPVAQQSAMAIGVNAGPGAPMQAGPSAATPQCGELGFLVGVSSTGRKELGRCPLKHTDVSADVSGFVSRVPVRPAVPQSLQRED